MKAATAQGTVRRGGAEPEVDRLRASSTAAIAVLLAVCASSAHAQARDPDDPYRYDLRFGLFPAAFQGALSQSYFGSAARGELDIARHLGVQVSGHAAWANVAGEDTGHAFALRAGFLLHVIDRVETSKLSGTVYPDDTPIVGGRGTGTDHDLDVPVSSRLGGSRLSPPDKDRSAEAAVRMLHTIRIGYDLSRAVERARPDASDGSTRRFVNTVHALYLGYGWGAHWNLSPDAAGGTREVGWRTFYADVLLTLPSFVNAKPTPSTAKLPPDPTALFIGGARIGMEGAIDALIHDAPGVGFAYSLELGALPGRSGVEGYVFIGLGLALDVAARGRSLRR
ncbi:MAG: hypothetical protein ACHQ53_09815 [Polyangiales bacterium]